MNSVLEGGWREGQAKGHRWVILWVCSLATVTLSTVNENARV